MNISVMQENLARGLSTVSRAVSSRATLPVLANVLLRTEDSGLKLTATNLEIGINCWVPGKVNAEGAITVPAKLFTDLVASLPNQRIDLELSTKDRTLRLTCGGSRASIRCRATAITLNRLCVHCHHRAAAKRRDPVIPLRKALRP